MKKLLFIVVSVSIVFISLLDSLQILTNNWSHASGYPLYELAEEKEISEYGKKYDSVGIYDSIEQDNYNLVRESRKNPQTGFNEPFVTLSDVDGTSLWTMKALNESNWRREFFTSFKGITAILGYDKSNSIVWVDEQGELINRLEFQNRLVTEPKTIKNGEIWIIQRIPGYEYIPEPNVKSSLTFCDSRGNVINKVELKYLVLDNEIAISKSEDYLIYSCEDIRRTSKDSFQYCSYLLNYDGSVIKEFEDIMLTFGGDFSDNEDVYVDRGSKSYIVDIATGNIMGTYSTQGRSVVANKETGILAVLDHGVLRIINYKTKQVLFQERFEGYPHPTYLEITGDAKEVIATSKNHQYTFRMKE